MGDPFTYHSERPDPERLTLVQTFGIVALIYNGLQLITPSSSESRVSNGAIPDRAISFWHRSNQAEKP